MEDNKVLTEEEIKLITDLRSQFQGLTQMTGEVSVQIMDLEIKRDQLKNNLFELQKQENEIIGNIEEKYGKGTISLETGEFVSQD
jgi:hypothetical protein